VAAEFLRNLGEPYLDASAHLREMLQIDREVFVQGVAYPVRGRSLLDAKRVIFLGAAWPTGSSSTDLVDP